MKVKNPRSYCRKLWRIFWNFFGFVAIFLIFKKREFATESSFFHKMAKTRHKFKNHCSGVVAVGDLSVFLAANFAPMSVLRALSLARSRGGTLAGCCRVSFMMFTVFLIKSRIGGCCRKFSLITPQGDV
jgi:hypothetical protein